LAHRLHEECVSPRARAALRPDDAGDLRGTLQLLLPAALLGRLRRSREVAAGRFRLRFRTLFRSPAQLSAPRLAGVVSLRGLARRLQVLSQGARSLAP